MIPTSITTNNEQEIPQGELLISESDVNFQFTYCNPALLNITGYAESDMLDQPQSMLHHPDVTAEFIEHQRTTLTSGLAWRAVTKCLCKDGGFFWAHIKARPIVKNGETMGFLYVRSTPDAEQIEQAKTLLRSTPAESADDLDGAGKNPKGGLLSRLF